MDCFASLAMTANTVRSGHRGTDPEAAHAALFPISNESSYATAHPLFLDGGHPGGTMRG
jgi:hypothetical protein